MKAGIDQPDDRIPVLDRLAERHGVARARQPRKGWTAWKPPSSLGLPAEAAREILDAARADR